jgi:hypothetical protein
VVACSVPYIKEAAADDVYPKNNPFLGTSILANNKENVLQVIDEAALWPEWWFWLAAIKPELTLTDFTSMPYIQL